MRGPGDLEISHRKSVSENLEPTETGFRASALIEITDG
jgi:hypothetical protein